MTNTQQIILDIDARVKSSNAATSLRELKQLTRELQSEALKYQGVNEEAFQAAQQAAAGLVDRMEDVREAISAAKGEPLEQLNSGFSLLKESILSLDFNKANLGLTSMMNSIKSIDIGKLKEGFASVVTNLASLGKTLLTNPIFLIGSAIALIVMNFEKLTKVGGLVGDMFKAVGSILDTIMKSVAALTDVIGLTDTKMQNLLDTTNQLKMSNTDLTASLREVEIARKEALGESTVAERYYQIYVDSINKASDALLGFGKSLGLSQDQLETLRAISEDFVIEVKDNLGNTLSYEIPESVKNFTKSLSIGGDKVKELIDKYIEYRKSVMTANSFLLTEEEKQEKQTAERIKNDREDRTKIVTNQRKRNLDDLKLNNDSENLELAKQQKKRLRELYELKNANEEFYDGAIIRQQELAKKGAISNDQLIEKTREFNNQRYKSHKEVDAEISNLITKRTDLTKSNLVEVLNLEGKTDDEKKKIVEAEVKRLEDQGLKIGQADEREKNRRIKYLQDRNKINLKADIELLDAKQTNLDAEADLLMRSIDFQFNTRNKSYKEINILENKKAKEIYDIQKSLADESYKIEKEKLDKELLLYADDEAKKSVIKSKLSYLESNYLLKLGTLRENYTTTVKENNEKVIRSDEKLAREKEKIAKDRIKVRQDLLESEKNVFSDQADMDQSELDRLSLGKEKFKLNTEEKLEIINDMYANQAAALRTAMEMELNQVDLSEEAKQRIREKYAEKQKLLAAQTADKKDQIEKAALQKQIEGMQYMADSFNGIADFMNEMDNMRRDENGKLDDKARREAFVRNKTLQTGAVIMNTAAGITNALSTPAGWPAAIAIGIAGAAQLAKVLATRYEPEGGGGGGGNTTTSGGAGGTIQAPTTSVAPSAPLMGQGYLNQQFNPMTFGGQIGLRPQQELRVYVLEQDISAMQNRVRVREGRSTLSGTI